MDMNNSKSRVIALLLVIPLLLIFVMTSVVETTQIIVDIPVSSVAILGDKVVDIDIATQSNVYQIKTEITPKNASNQTVTLDFDEQVPGQEKANVKITDDGKVVALSLGSVIITATAGNGRQDKIQINFTMNAVSDVSAVTMQVPIKVGESIDLTDGQYLAKRGTINNATWTSEKPQVASVNDLGVVKGQSVGNTSVSGAIAGKHLNAQTGEVTDKVYNVTYQVDVTSVVDTQTGLAFINSPKSPDGLHIKPTMGKANFTFTCDEQKLQQYGGLTTYVSADDQQGIATAELTQLADGSFSLDVQLADTAQENVKYAVEIRSANPLMTTDAEQTAQGDYITTVYVQKGYWTYINLNQTRQAMVVKSNSQNLLALASDIMQEASSIMKVTYKSSNPEVLTVQTVGNTCRLTSKSTEGSALVWAEVEILGTVVETNKVQIAVVDPAKSITFGENTQDLGIENIKTIADNEVVFANGLDKNDPTTYNFYKKENNYTLTSTTYTLQLNANKQGSGQKVNNADIIWRSSDENIATVTNGVVTVVGSGEVTITASSAYNEMLGLDTPVVGQVTLRCVKDSLWVDDYYDLMFAMERTIGGVLASMPAVLRNDVMLAPVLGDVTFTDYRNYLDNFATSTMQTTMDGTYYKDNNRWEDAKIRYCVNVTNDIYGNGRYICGEYITNSKRLTGYTNFEGPLDLVRASYTENNALENAAVKAQDNVVFMVNTPNITLCNVELKGCADETLHGWFQQDGVTPFEEPNLSNFDNVGTVLEVVEDGCNLVYSRVNNGRTVVRIFGKAYQQELAQMDLTTQQQYIKANAQSLRTQTTISNCILEYGREFVLKLSSNQIVKNKSTIDHNYTEEEKKNLSHIASPKLSGYDQIGGLYSGQSGYQQQVENFYNDFVLTDVTLRNSVLANSGLFCVGFESRFAGSLLFGENIAQLAKYFNLPESGWAHVAGTSMPARLKLEGDVRFYDWKVLANVNAESLIEVSPNFVGHEYLSLNIQQMVETFQNKQLADSDAKLLVEKQGKLYINGATAFYGGGKNYSYIDTSGTNSNFVPLECYSVPMNMLPHPLFTTAAGEESFRFYLYNSNSSLDINQQTNDMADNTAYSWLYR